MFSDKWHIRFMGLARTVAQWSKDPSTKCGAVIVRPNKTIASVGYNGFPRHLSDTPHLLEDREHKYPRIIHAEMNAILNTNENLEGYVMYTWPGSCCCNCAKHMIQAGIKVICSRFISDEEMKEKRALGSRWGSEWVISASMFKEAGVEMIPIDFPDE